MGARGLNPDIVLKALMAEVESPEEGTFMCRLHEALCASASVEMDEANAVAFAELYYQLLACCQRVYSPIERSGDAVPLQVRQDLVTILGNISQIDKVVPSRAAGRSYVAVVSLLGTLRADAERGQISLIADAKLREVVEPLLSLLDDIDIAFDMRQADGTRTFPIGNVIANAINRIVEDGKTIKLREVQLLRLAARLFGDPGSDEQIGHMLHQLQVDCSLEFIGFLRGGCRIIDVPGNKSFKMNGSMIFWDPQKRRVLVRHDSASYFFSNDVYAALSTDEFKVRSEFDRAGHVIGSYVVFDLANKDSLPLGVSDLVQNESGIQRLLELLFDIGARNILMDRALIEGSDGKVYPINPWCTADQHIVKNSHGAGKVYFRRQDVVDAFGEYRMLPAAVYRSRPLNRVTFGLCAQLLSSCSAGVNRLALGGLDGRFWYQEQVLANWAAVEEGTGERRVSSEDLLRILELWERQLEYCGDMRMFEEREFAPIDFLPLAHSEASLYRLLGSGRCDDDAKLFCGNVEKDEDGEEYVNVIPARTYASSRAAGNGRLIPAEVRVSRLSNYEEMFPDGMPQGEVYFLYSSENRRGCVVETRLGKAFAEIEKRQRGRLSMSFGVGAAVDDSHCDVALACMMLFSDEFAGASPGCLVDGLGMESILLTRLLHNLIWSNVAAERVPEYFHVLERHQLLDYEGMADDLLFTCQEPGVLYVPKDRRGSDSVLRRLLEDLSGQRYERERKGAYSTELDVRSDESGVAKYYVRGDDVPISRVVFLTDNIMGGNSTGKALVAYLGDESSISATERMTIYRDRGSGETVSLRDILEVNGASFQVHAYYASEQGRKAVDECLSGIGIAALETTSHEDLSVVVDSNMEKACQMWPWGGGKEMRSKAGSFAVIRKHSMPKRTLFPPAMTDYPKRFICMLVKKSELTL